MKLLATLLACLALTSGAYAANIPVSGLPSRGTVASTDLIPVLPVGGTSLEATTVGAIALLGGSTPSLNSFAGVDPTGAIDSTTGIQNAINAGQSLTCNGIYKISATITLSTAASYGQQIAGAGPTSSLGTPTTARCIFQPTSALAGPVFKIDGTPIGQYIQGVVFSNITIDMTNMSDVSTNIAFDQIQAFDDSYTNVRVINYGINKLSWQFLAGAYTTSLINVQGGLINFQGTSFANENTTITVINSDIVGFSHDYFGNVLFSGGAIQRGYSSAVPVIYLAPGVTPQGYATNTAGLYAGVLSQLIDSQNFTVSGTDFEYAGGFTPTGGCSAGQYNDGTHGCLTFVPVIEVQSTALNTTFINPSFSGVYELDLSTSTTTFGANIGGGAALDLFNVNTWFTGYSTAVINGNTFSGFSDRGVTQTFSLNASNGVGTFQGSVLQPATDADGVFRIKSQNGTFNVDVSTSASGGALLLENGTGFAEFSDVGITLTSNLAAGVMKFYASGSPTITLTAANGTILAAGIVSTPIGPGGTASTGAFTTLTASSSPTFPTPTAGDNTTKAATTAFVTAAVAAATPAATTSTAGIVALATGAQVLAGTDTTHAVTPASLTSQQSIAANGYDTLPGGLFLQWGQSGSVSANSSTGGAVTFPHACASAVYSVTITPSQNMGTGGMALSYVTSVGTTGFTIFNSAPNAGAYYWQATCK